VLTRIEVPEDYSVRVRSLRGCIELTQTQLAKRIGVSFATVNRWENGQSKPTRLAWQQILDLEAEIATSEVGGGPVAAPARTHERAAIMQAAAQERLAQLLGLSAAVIYSFEVRGTPTFVSDNIKRVLGYEPLDYLENPNFWRERIHPDDLARVETEISRTLEKGATRWSTGFAGTTALIVG